ncbi:MAG: ribulose-phosphate 3-epimerase, partial [Alteraurantiacibacter sp.]|nr:ribulose-phosphate 3-epimerase [Alteraurantiacibacter sp.]
VMDGHYVPNLTIGPAVVKALRPHSAKTFDVHLMVSPVDLWIEPFASAGADIITVHPEAGPHVHRSVQTIRSLGKKAGISLNPGTPAKMLDYLLEEIDLVLVMSVNPGFGGQGFISSQLRKIEAIRKMIDARGLDVLIEVDGGINAETARACVAAGADVLVAGSATFAGGSEFYAANIRSLKGV